MRRPLKVLYLFSGLSRRSSVKEFLEEVVGSGAQAGRLVEVVEVDTLNDASHDLLDSEARLRYLEDVREGRYHAVLVTPPCST